MNHVKHSLYESIKQPIVFFDIESTGLDVVHDRIVEIYFYRIDKDGTRSEFEFRVKPVISMSEEASKINGIKDEDLVNCPSWEVVGKEIIDIIKDTTLVSYNGTHFDMNMLFHEMFRVGYNLTGTKSIDVYQIWVKNERRNLENAYKRFCNKTLRNAHHAKSDVLPLPEILANQFDEFGKDAIREGFSIFEYLPKQLKRIDGELVFAFGKHIDKRIIEKDCVEFYKWMKNKFDNTAENKLLFQYIEEEYDKNGVKY